MKVQVQSDEPKTQTVKVSYGRIQSMRELCNAIRDATDKLDRVIDGLQRLRR